MTRDKLEMLNRRGLDLIRYEIATGRHPYDLSDIAVKGLRPYLHLALKEENNVQLQATMHARGALAVVVEYRSNDSRDDTVSKVINPETFMFAEGNDWKGIFSSEETFEDDMFVLRKLIFECGLATLRRNRGAEMACQACPNQLTCLAAASDKE